MADSINFAGAAEVVERFGDLLDQWTAILRRVLVQEVSGAGPVTLTDAAHGGKSLLVSNGGSQAVIVLNLPAGAEVGTLFLIDQVGVAPVKIVPPAGASLRNRSGHNGPAGQWASVSVKCIRPNEWLLGGDTDLIA